MYQRALPSPTEEEAMSLLHSSLTTSLDQGQEVAIPTPESYHSVSILLPPKKRSLSKMPSHIFKLKSGSSSKQTSSKENPFKQGNGMLPERVSVKNDESTFAAPSESTDEWPSSGLQLSPVSLGYLELSGDQRRPSLSPLSEGFDDTRVVPLAPLTRVEPLPSAFSSDAAPEFTNPFATPHFPPSGFGNPVLAAGSATHNNDLFPPSPTTPLSAITNVGVDLPTFGPTRVKVKGKALIILGEEAAKYPGNDM
ncbi:uncharacterized protein EV420DRAFT_1762206 [Desarmillaria tabescens]|uniref:Uncharacterized protein n=1 Tax=Armillaria tabescens TaxID=1929756 RepID=A0AA39NAJ2_ARMTA|nr:uncharacterized protein EV420DRAFT_1762206 [Desarmillaria tabescens]KAK0462065.1 hypothetical protein EV420DRAFT_1762206 [Desarmillaria tabescens]